MWLETLGEWPSVQTAKEQFHQNRWFLSVSNLNYEQILSRQDDKIIGMSNGDLSSNVIHTIYALFIHNYILLAYLLGLIISVFIAFKKPSRFSLFLILGFAILAFSFEYDKHIVEGLRQQTLQSLITAQPHQRIQKWTSLIIGEILPIFFYVFGWLMIYLAILIEGTKQKRKN